MPDQEPDERQRQFRRNRQEQAARQDEDEHADVSESVDHVEDPPYEIGEQTAHRASSSYLLEKYPDYAP